MLVLLDELQFASVDVCLKCGSSGDWDQFLFCADCGEAFHAYCLVLELRPRLRPAV